MKSGNGLKNLGAAGRGAWCLDYSCARINRRVWRRGHAPRAAPAGGPDRRAPCLVARGVAVVDQAEIERGSRAQLQLLQRREISVVGAALRHRQMEEVD